MPSSCSISRDFGRSTRLSWNWWGSDRVGTSHMPPVETGQTDASTIVQCTGGKTCVRTPVCKLARCTASNILRTVWRLPVPDLCSHTNPKTYLLKLEMWPDAQRDGRPAEYRWRPVRKFHNSIPCTTPQSLANTRCWSTVQWRCQYRTTQDLDVKWLLHGAKLFSQTPCQA